MSRFYTNPFVKDAPLECAVTIGEPRYSGISVTALEGIFKEWYCDIEYSGGSKQSRLVKRERVRWKDGWQR